MKSKQLKELKNKTKEELLKELSEIKQKVLTNHLDLLRGKVKNTRIKKGLRRDISQILTIIKQKEVIK